MTKKQLDMMKQWLNEVMNNAWEDGAREERQNVVAWLRAHVEIAMDMAAAGKLANFIERGEHRREGEE